MNVSEITEKERLLKVIRGEATERPPVICPGGMMNAAVSPIIEKTGINLIEAHMDYSLMAQLAEAVHSETGFENFGIPFCMTVEAEICGSDIDFGGNNCEPKITKERFESAAKLEKRDIGGMMDEGRIKTIITATNKLAEYHPDTPVVASLTGPVSTAASVVNPMRFFRDLRKDPENSHILMDYTTEVISEFACRLAAAGATVIAIADPTATGELLSPQFFSEYAVPYMKRLIDAIHMAGVPAILHICGKIRTVEDQFQAIGADVYSVDAMVNMKNLKYAVPDSCTMGNLNTFVLQEQEEQIQRFTGRLLDIGVDIISPACGLSMSTPIEHIRLMTDTVKRNFE
jgi:[methyl-Co(III) methanol-specific corrinoid protein]:coenzyme M methyltransferase